MADIPNDIRKKAREVVENLPSTYIWDMERAISRALLSMREATARDIIRLVEDLKSRTFKDDEVWKYEIIIAAITAGFIQPQASAGEVEG